MSQIDSILRSGYAAHQAGDLEHAESAYRRVLEINPDDSDACNLLGLLLLNSGNPGGALPVLRKAASLAPENPETRFNYGLAAFQSDSLTEAREQFQKACELAPDNIEAIVAAANVARDLKESEVARGEYEQALRAQPNHPGARHGLSLVLNDLGVEANKAGDSAGAEQLFEQSVANDETNFRAWMNLGLLNEQLGDEQHAGQAFSSAIRTKPDFADAHYHLAHLRSHQSTDAECAAMEKLFETAGGSAQDRSMLAFGLACAAEQREDYSTEFSWLTKARAINQQRHPWTADRTHKQVSHARANWSGSSFDAGEDGRRLIFVVGMPRSGTSLAEQILASHANVFGAGEALSVADIPVDARTSDAELAAFREGCEKKIRTGSTSEEFAVETTPINFLHLGKIAALFPSATIVHCMRDPRDTCISIYQHPLSAAHAYANDLEQLGNYYCEYRSLMDHWRATLPNTIFELEYETLARDFEPTVRTLLKACDLPFDEQCLRFHETGRRVKTPSSIQVRQPIYESSIGRWKRYEADLQPLLSALRL